MHALSSRMNASRGFWFPAFIGAALLVRLPHAAVATDELTTRLVVDNDFGGAALNAIFGGSTCLKPRLPTRFDYLVIGPLGRSPVTTVAAHCDGFIRMLMEPVRDQSEVDACEVNIARAKGRFTYTLVPPQGQATACSIDRVGGVFRLHYAHIQ